MAADPEWVTHARIGGTDINRFMSGAELLAILEERRAQGVTVVELDSAFSQYLSDEEFEAEARLMDFAAEMAHRLGMRAVAYYPSLEILTEGDASTGPRPPRMAPSGH